MEPRTLADTFADLRARRQIGLLPFIPAGYPDLAATRALLPALEEGGASAVEIGIPFSDPIADGPVVQEAFTYALSKKLRLAEVFEAVKDARPTTSLPLLAMVSYSLVFRYGPQRFYADARVAGFNGLILPDVPLPEAAAACEQVRATGLDTVLLIAPTTPPDRRRDIARHCSGFVYYLSVSGITGERERLPPDLEANLRQLREVSPVPICVGFGISKPEHVAQLAPLADGAIVGSAVVKRLKKEMTEGGSVPDQLARSVRAYCRELLSQVR
jgi:tryptophan synthase alpha chain